MFFACGDSSETSESLTVAVESQDRIVSEDGELELTAGTIAIRSISLIGTERDVFLLGPIVLDLALPDQQAPIDAPVPTGEFTGLRIELAPPAEGGQMLDVQLQTLMGAESVRAVSELTMTGETFFPEGARILAEGDEVELLVTLTGMFFYLSPLTSAVDGVFHAGENERGSLSMDLIGMFDLHVLP